MNIKEIANTVGAQWRGEFIHFVNTGEATPEFLNNIDSNPELQAAVEAAFQVQAKAVEHIARRIEGGEELSPAKSPGLVPVMISSIKGSLRSVIGKKA